MTTRSTLKKPIWLLALATIALAATMARAAPPDRVVSMNVCTDQLAMLIADDAQLVSVSYLALQPQSSVLHAEAAAAGYAVNHGLAEEIFLLEPDLVLAGRFSGRMAASMLERLGFRVEMFEPALTFEDIKANIQRIGALLGRTERAADLVAELDAALQGLDRADDASPTAAAFFANSYTVGAGALLHDTMRRGGWRNAAIDYGVAGVGKLPLEVLVSAPPDALVSDDRDATGVALATEVLQHPALREVAERVPTIRLADAVTICGAPFTAQAVRRFAEARAALLRQARR